MEDDFEDEFKDELENLSKEIIGMLANDILDEAYYNSYLVITERVTFEELVDGDGHCSNDGQCSMIKSICLSVSVFKSICLSLCFCL